MAEPVRFFFDEHVADAVAVALRARGIDILTALDAGRTGRADAEQLRFATSAGRVVVTHDTDYLVLAANFQARGEVFAGVAFCLARKYARNVGKLAHALADLHGVFTADDMQNHLEYL